MKAVKEYFFALLLAAVVMLAFILLLTPGGEQITPRVINRSLASGTLIMLGMVLLLGPLSRVYDLFDRWLAYRKEIGIVAFLMGAVHVYLAMFPLARSGPFGLFKGRPWSAYPGIIGLAILSFLFVISFHAIQRRIEAGRWWKMQYWGVRIAAVLVFMHMTVLKYKGWISWLNSRATEPDLPSSSLLAASFVAFVFLVRISEMLGRTTARFLIPMWAIILIAVEIWFFL